jgi:hypothetical protein
MELEIIRTYHPTGTNGALFLDGVRQCYTIELPWLNNQPRRSCIPEGRYGLQKRYSPRFKHHLLLLGVPGRSLILVHPANNALKELAGCIAPVSQLTGPGRGLQSRVAFEWLLALVYPALKTEPVFLTLKTIKHDTTQNPPATHSGTHPSLL